MTSSIELRDNLLVSLDRECVIASITSNATEEEINALANCFELKDAVFSFVESAERGAFKPATSIKKFKKLIKYGE